MPTARLTSVVATAAALCLVAAACAPAPSKSASSSSTSPSGSACAAGSLHTYKSGQLTVATDSPAYSPWFDDNDPSDGKGFESAVAYAVAKQLGFTKSEVAWTYVPFNRSFAPGTKRV